MKKNIRFSKGFLLCAIISILLIASGVVGYFVNGINYGLDFKPGLVEEVRIAPAAMTITYTGTAKIAIEAGSSELNLVVSGAGAENRTESFTYGKYPTIAVLANALDSIEGISANVAGSPDADTYAIFVNSAVSTNLSEVPYSIYVSSNEEKISADDLRAALASFGSKVDIKEMGSAANRSFQIRMSAGSNDSSESLRLQITGALDKTYGSEKVSVIKTEFVGSQYSTTIINSSILLVLATMVLIWLYATFRFHWDFALGSVIALFHDICIMMTYIIWAKVEFSIMTLSAVLTIVGYSINASVVILDRVRGDIKIVQTHKFNDILDAALTETLSRSIITTLTVLFVSIVLFVFCTGSMKDFANCMNIGLLSGCYSSIFICGGFISHMRRRWEPGEYAMHVAPHVEKQKNIVKFDSSTNA